jgi:chemotaxis protein MotB
MIKKTVVGILVVTLFTSCVSKKIYNELENKFAELKKENRSLADNNEELQKSKNQLETDNKNLIDELAKTKSERDKLLADYTASQKNLKTLQESYNALEKNSDDALKTNLDKNRELLAKLEAKEKALTAEQARLDKLKNDLEASSKRLSELEQLIATKDANMKKLKESLTKSLKAFDGKGLTVYEKDGKVYVSMENKLLFDTGSWAVNAEGKKAVVEVGKVLAQNTDVMVLIEGHTDNDKILGNIGGGIENNWDLSTKRATAIVTILTENKAINKQNLTAAGRGEFAPIATNDNAEGKAKNRRIEIILTPKLDEISKMLNEL